MNYLDVLSKLGVGSAHPGGFSATLEQLKQFPLPQGARILEAGCGTGRTTCYLAAQGFDMTGLDLRDDMLAKARDRAAAMGLGHVPFVQGDIGSLPFAEAAFDVVMCESVTGFGDIAKALSEYYRVLKPGGVLYDREMMIMKPLKEEQFRRIVDFFGLKSAHSPEDWLRLLEQAGFADSRIWNPSRFPENLTEEIPDPYETPDEGTFADLRVWQLMIEHDDIIVGHKEHLGFGVMVAHKHG